MAPHGVGEDDFTPEAPPPQNLRRLHAVEPSEAEPASHTPERALPNLPLELSSFVGREKELAEVKRLLEVNRLLTLTGSGGCGKTRLALAAASEVVEGFEDGVWMVELASLADPSLVPQAVASSLDVREQPGRSLIETLSDYLGSKKVLLVLDNCEHLIEACAELAEALLRSCPELRVLATSREALGITGEVAWRSEEHTSELQSRQYLVCRLLLEKKKKYIYLKEYTHITEKQDAHSSKTSCSRNFYIQYYINYTQIMTILHNIL